jgi:hypothetical protein
LELSTSSIRNISSKRVISEAMVAAAVMVMKTAGAKISAILFLNIL